MMEITRIDSGPRMSEAVLHGGKVYLSGMVADAAAGQTVAAQTSDILAQIDAMLASVGSDKSKLLKTNIWLSDIGTIGQMNAVWDAWVIPGQTPVRATVEAKLASPEWAVEIMVEAAL
jgi:enamine deaminase RidA (YjgF/YER057c/UK114 family)